jgi:GT2 family glycosyltransferase
MPQLSGWLNAVARRARRWAGAPRAGERLDAPAFLRHAARLARATPAPRGLWLSLIGPADGPVPPGAEVVADFAAARAPYVARLDAGARLAPHALALIAAALAENPEAVALYTDEIAGGEVVLKPAFDPVLLDGFDYFGRLAVYRRETVAALGGFGPDYELALRVAAAAPPGGVLHLPYPAYIGPARRQDPEAMRAAHGARVFASGLAPDRLRPALALSPWPKVGVVIPSRDAPELIGAALEGLFARTDYPAFDVTVIDNGSTDPRTLALYARHAGPRLRVDIRPEAFNFSRACNRGAGLSDAEVLLFLNNDVEAPEPGWLMEMVSCLAYPATGIVGAKLLYPDGALQHAGVIAGLGGYAGHWHIGRPEDEYGPQRRLAVRQSLSVVTGACMLATRACFDAVGGFDEQTFPVAYNDVDFCLRAGAAGFRTIWTPFARLIHHESATRGSDETPQQRARFARDKAALQARHRTDILEDRAYNPWAARGHSDPWPQARADLPKPRA